MSERIILFDFVLAESIFFIFFFPLFKIAQLNNSWISIQHCGMEYHCWKVMNLKESTRHILNFLGIILQFGLKKGI